MDDVLMKMGYIADPNKSKNRILCGADNKIGKSLIQLMAKDPKYNAFLPEFPVLHLRKSKINILFSAYKQAGLVEIVKYLKEEDTDDWAKLVSISHIDMETRFIKRLALALHLAFLLSFTQHLEPSYLHEITNDLEELEGIEISGKGSKRFSEYLSEGSQNNPTFELHLDIMKHCDEVVAIALAERLGGEDGYALLLQAVKSSLLFSFLNNASAYGPYCVKLLYHHYSAGSFHQCLKKELFSTHFKGSLKNFGLDTKREIDHLDALKGFRSGSTVASATCRMSLIDSLNETSRKSHVQKREDDDMLGWELTDKDLAFIYKAASLILRRGGLSLEKSDFVCNVYSKTPLILPFSILDSCSQGVGKFLVRKFLHKENLYCLRNENWAPDTEIQGQSELVNRAKRSKATTIKRVLPSLIKRTKTELQIREESRKRKVDKESKTIDLFSSSNNTCQALLKADSSKPKVMKALGMKRALVNVVKSCNGLKDINEYIDLNKNSIPDSISALMKVCLFEFAGVKFKTANVKSGIEYLDMTSNLINGIISKSNKIATAIVCEEKYSFTPDTLKADTRKQRETATSDVSHLKTPDCVISDSAFSKELATKTAIGKRYMSMYLAKNITKLTIKKNVRLIVDSEAFIEKSCSCTDECACVDYCIPVSCSRQPNTSEGLVQRMLEIKQRKGEAEMSVVDWLISMQNQHMLEEGEAVVSVITSGDIDAVYIHLFAVCRFWRKTDNNEYRNPVYVVLQKPGGKYDIYNITRILKLLEDYYVDNLIGCKLAVALAIGGNDFLPKFYSHSHDALCKAVLGNINIRNSLLCFEDGKCILNKPVYLELIKFIYTPKRFQPSDILYDDVRALTISKTVDTNAKSGFQTTDPRKWLPPKSCIERLTSLVQLQIDYLQTAGIHEIKPLRMLCDCLHKNVDGESVYDFGPDAYFRNIDDLPNVPKHLISKSARKRQLLDTPQRGQRRKKQVNLDSKKTLNNSLEP